jgi:hypothetical protein
MGDDQVRFQVAAALDQVAAGGRHRQDLVAQAREKLLEILPHVGFVVGDDDA